MYGLCTVTVVDYRKQNKFVTHAYNNFIINYLYKELYQMKSIKNGTVILVVVINLQEEPDRSKKIYWRLYQQCDHLVIVLLIPEVDRRKMVYQSKDMLHQEVALSDLLMTSTFMLDK